MVGSLLLAHISCVISHSVPQHKAKYSLSYLYCIKPFDAIQHLYPCASQLLSLDALVYKIYALASICHVSRVISDVCFYLFILTVAYNSRRGNVANVNQFSETSGSRHSRPKELK